MIGARLGSLALLGCLIGCTTIYRGEDGDDGGGGSDGGGDADGGEDGRGLQFGTLLAMPEHAVAEAAVGISAAMVELAWNRYEVEDDVFDEGYLAAVRAEMDAHVAAGRSITFQFVIHYHPQWLLALPDSRMVDDLGNLSEDANLVFDQRLRDAAADFIAHAVRQLDVAAIHAIRLTSGVGWEVNFPATGTYWAFDPEAQNGPNMPPSMAPNPQPGWRPGDPGLTAADVRAWIEWYIDALVDTVEWQIAVLSGLGFDGYYEVLTAGAGVRRSQYEAAIEQGLPPGLLGTGSVWHRFYDKLPRRPDIVAYTSSVADLSGAIDNDQCEPGDVSIALDSPLVEDWSAARWISRLAHEYGFQIGGENPGFNAAPGLSSEYQLALNASYQDMSDAGMMASAIRQAEACGFGQFYWAHDGQLWDGTASFSRFAELIAARR